MAPRTDPKDWGKLFNFLGAGLVHFEIFAIFGGGMPGQTLLEWIASQLLQRGTHAARPAADTVAEGTEYYESDTKFRFKAVAGAWVDDGNGNPDPDQSILLSEVTFTDAQIKALPTTPLQLLAAPGANKINLPIAVFLRSNFAAGHYGNTGAESYLYTAWGPDEALHGWANAAADDDARSLDFLTNFLNTDYKEVFLCPERAYETTEQFEYWSLLPAYLNQTDPGPQLNQPFWLRVDNGGAGDWTGGNAANTLKVLLLYTQRTY